VYHVNSEKKLLYICLTDVVIGLIRFIVIVVICKKHVLRNVDILVNGKQR